MIICKIRCFSVPLLLALIVLLCSCIANPTTSLQLTNTPVSAEYTSAANAVSKIFADNETAMEAPPLEPKILATDIASVPPGPSEPATGLVVSSDNLSNYNGNEVIVEGTVVELGSFIDPGLGKALVLYFNYPGQHVTSYEAWSKGMTGTDFRVIIRENDIPKFCYRSMFVGRRIAVEGEMDIYHGAPVIFVSDPSQVTFVGIPSAPEPSLSIVITCTTEIADNTTWSRYQGTITNNNTEWAVHDLYLGENKLADCIPPKGCPDIVRQYLEKQILTKAMKCPNNIKFDVRFSGDAVAGAEADPLTKQISIPVLRYKWKSVP